MAIPNDFYTPTTLFSLSGCSTAVLIITSVIGYLLEPKFDSGTIKKWFGLFLSIVLALVGVTQLKEKDLVTWIVSIVNGFLIYLTAVGANTIIAHSGKVSQSPIPTSTLHRHSREKFISLFSELWWK
ncbi:hypothetical protein VB774_23295 [Pseudanabaena galeata UHCC 0370]|uniref:Uncharacterized protein n=1 Tax=Pseudanabaena galeata UHCC 0370 TaxID=3110310 RepID=A0ABU5TQL9_9CYAN|nr:hypothetical protein [Pseudanabaena galeata]MEA5480572.1 hypothetical protein [Pseudanabaena galeata UHCC 0370]